MMPVIGVLEPLTECLTIGLLGSCGAYYLWGFSIWKFFLGHCLFWFVADLLLLQIMQGVWFVICYIFQFTCYIKWFVSRSFWLCSVLPEIHFKNHFILYLNQSCTRMFISCSKGLYISQTKIKSQLQIKIMIEFYCFVSFWMFWPNNICKKVNACETTHSINSYSTKTGRNKLNAKDLRGNYLQE